MPIVADASVAIRGDMTGFQRDLRGAEAEVGGWGKRIQSMFSVKGLLGAGALFGIGTTLPGLFRDVIGFAGDAGEKFRDLVQSGQTIDQVFGDSAETIRDWGERAAEAAGLTKQEVQESAAVLGQTLVNMGLDVDESADLVVQAQQRAADLAIAYGRDVGDAISGISALMRGEYDTIEKFGVRIKEVDVNARIAALGLDTSTEAAERQAEAIATLDLFFEQTKGSAGRFAEGAETTAVRLEQAGAKWDNFATEHVGPMVNSILDGAATVGEGFVDIAEAPGQFFDDFNPEVEAKVQRLADSWGVGTSIARDRIREGANQAGLEYQEQLDHLIAIADGAGQELGNAGERAGKDLARGFQNSRSEVEAAAITSIRDPLIEAMLGGKEEAERIASETPGAIAQAMLDRQFDVESAADSLAQTAEDALHPLIERYEIITFLASQELQDGLNSAIPAVAQRARELKQAAEDRLAELDGAAWHWGNSAGKSFAAGMDAAYGYVITSAGTLAAAVRGQIGINSEPSDPTSPLRGITKWGGNIVHTIADGIYGELGTGYSAAGALAGALVPVSGAGMAASLASSGGGVGNTYNVYVESLPEHPTLAEIGGDLKSLGDMGKLPGSKKE